MKIEGSQNESLAINSELSHYLARILDFYGEVEVPPRLHLIYHRARSLGLSVRPIFYYDDEDEEPKGKWLLIEDIEKPDLGEKRSRTYSNDSLGNLIEKLRKEGMIRSPRVSSWRRLRVAIGRFRSGKKPVFTPNTDIPISSRFSINPDELEKYVFPELAERLGTGARLPSIRELRLFDEFWKLSLGETSSCEWVLDTTPDGKHLGGGDVRRGGLYFFHAAPRNGNPNIVGFRIAIEVPS